MVVDYRRLGLMTMTPLMPSMMGIVVVVWAGSIVVVLWAIEVDNSARGRIET